MEFKVLPLSPESGAEFCAFFDHLDYSYKPDWQGCFCQYYHTTCDDAGWRSRSPEQNRASALDLIARGEMRGYLAYVERKCVGWCSANALAALPRLAVFPELAQFDGPSGVIICFVIHPEYRGKARHAASFAPRWKVSAGTASRACWVCLLNGRTTPNCNTTAAGLCLRKPALRFSARTNGVR